jgi:hypothetical protein
MIASSFEVADNFVSESHGSWLDVYPRATLPLMKEKDAGMRIRIERELRDEFLTICREQDRPAAQIIREFMRQYIAAKRSTRAGQTSSERDSIDAQRGGE